MLRSVPASVWGEERQKVQFTERNAIDMTNKVIQVKLTECTILLAATQYVTMHYNTGQESAIQYNSQHYSKVQLNVVHNTRYSKVSWKLLNQI